MYTWWMYIRSMFEEHYALKENPFECIVENVKNGYGRCICIPCVAVNYIASEIKFWEKTADKSLTWGLEWEEEHGIYLVKREAEDWNKEIYDIKAHGITLIHNAELCIIAPTDYSYIKIRDREILQQAFEEPRKMLYSLLTDIGERKTEIEFYTAAAREFRNRFPMEEYIDKLFRLLFFLHPLECLKVIERNMRNCGSMKLKKYNQKLLEDYQKLINDLEKIPASKYRVNMFQRLRKIEEFVGIKIVMVYVWFNRDKKYGDIEVVHELFQKKMNDTLKLGSLGKDSRINKLKKKYLSV